MKKLTDKDRLDAQAWALLKRVGNLQTGMVHRSYTNARTWTTLQPIQSAHLTHLARELWVRRKESIRAEKAEKSAKTRKPQDPKGGKP